MAQKCKARTNRGKACSAWAQAGSDFCYTHDPARAQERAAARGLGGHNRRTAHAGDSSTLPARVRSVQDVYQVLDFTLAETVALDNSIIRTRAIIALSECYLHVLEAGELEERVKRLEAQYESQ